MSSVESPENLPNGLDTVVLCFLKEIVIGQVDVLRYEACQSEKRFPETLGWTSVSRTISSLPLFERYLRCEP